jgi:hypothetical protein
MVSLYKIYPYSIIFMSLVKLVVLDNSNLECVIAHIWRILISNGVVEIFMFSFIKI